MARFSYKYPDPLTGGAPPNIPQNVYVIGVALVVGLMTGAGAEALKYLVKAISQIVTAGVSPGGWNWIFIILPTIGILLAVLYQRYILRQQIAHGVERMTRLLHTDTPYLPSDQIWSPVIGAGLTLGFGGSAGTEGPIATAGGALGSNMARWCNMPAPMVRAMLVIGAGAGIAGIFKAPVGGMLFAIEVLGITMS
ncbi:MAG: chloride channel protein, partial [Muribaculaceae bacterium]|nr:chloride channel protein [Muribaculaceae bacterium]